MSLHCCAEGDGALGRNIPLCRDGSGWGEGRKQAAGAALPLPQILVGAFRAACHRAAAGGFLSTSLLGDSCCAVQPLMAVLPSGTSLAPSQRQQMLCTKLKERCSLWVGAAATGSALPPREATPVAPLLQSDHHSPDEACFRSPRQPTPHCHGPQLRCEQPPHPRDAGGTVPGGQWQ